MLSVRVITTQSSRWERYFFYSVLVTGPDVSVLIFSSQTPRSCDLLLFTLTYVHLHLESPDLHLGEPAKKTILAQGCL